MTSTRPRCSPSRTATAGGGHADYGREMLEQSPMRRRETAQAVGRTGRGGNLCQPQPLEPVARYRDAPATASRPGAPPGLARWAALGAAVAVCGLGGGDSTAGLVGGLADRGPGLADDSKGGTGL